MDKRILFYKNSSGNIIQDNESLLYDASLFKILEPLAMTAAKLNCRENSIEVDINRYETNLNSTSPNLPHHLSNDGKLLKTLQYLEENEQKEIIKKRLQIYINKLKQDLVDIKEKIISIEDNFKTDFTNLQQSLKTCLPVSSLPSTEHAVLLLDNLRKLKLAQFNITLKKNEEIKEKKKKEHETAKQKKANEMELDSGPPPTAEQFSKLLIEFKQLKNLVKNSKIPNDKPKNLSKGNRPPEKEKDGKKAQKAPNQKNNLKRKAPQSFTQTNAPKRAKVNQKNQFTRKN